MSRSAPEVTLKLPSVLRVMVGTDRATVRGRTVQEALEAAFAALPHLREHLTQDSGELRPHVLCLLNGEALPRGEVASTRLQDGDALEIHQAISGG